MISSVFTLKEASFIPDELAPVKQTMMEENYYTNKSLDFLVECHNELLSCRQDFYKSILEADNQYAINESFNDILNKIKNIIKKILAYIETLIRRFITQLGKYISSDKYILSMKNEIKKFPSNKSFTISGYNFTIDEKIPAIDIDGLDLSKIRQEIQSIEKDDDITTKISKLAILLTEFSSESKMNDIRGQILNINRAVTETDFTNTVFALYRDNKSSESDIKINREDVLKILKDYEEYKDKIKTVKSLQNNINAKYKTLEKQINNIISDNMKLDGSSKLNNKIDAEGYGTDQATKLKNTLDNLVSTQVNQIQRIANLHLRAIAGKLDAYSALTMQSRGILYKALNIVQSDIDNTFVMRESLDLSSIEEGLFNKKKNNIVVEKDKILSNSESSKIYKIIEKDLKKVVRDYVSKNKKVIRKEMDDYIKQLNDEEYAKDEFGKYYKSGIPPLSVEQEEISGNDLVFLICDEEQSVRSSLFGCLEEIIKLFKANCDSFKFVKSIYTGDGDEGCIYMTLNSKTVSDYLNEYYSYDYTRDAINKGYILEKQDMDLRQKHFVDECLALSESNIPELKQILEDLQLDEKNAFDKLKDLLIEIFNKFSEKLKSLFTRDKTFLEKNKDTILNKKIPEYTLNNMPAYSLGIKNIEDSNLPVTANLDKLLPLTEVEIQKIILPKYDGNGEFAEFAKRFFLCNNEENKDRKSTDPEIDMKNIYDFCIDNSRINSIANGVKNYASEVTKIKYEISRLPKNESFNEFGYNYIYSSILELYINEEDANDTKKEPETTIEKNPDDKSSSQQTAKTNLKLDKEEKPEDKNDNDDNKKEETKKSNIKAKETANWYLKNLRIAIAAKMTAYQKIYSEYMSIIKHHVNVANGKTTEGKDQSEVFNAMKDYLKADDKKAAAEKVISAMKAYDGRTIDAHDVEILVNKNKAELEKG